MVKTDTDINAEIQKHTDIFKESLKKENMDVVNLITDTEDTADSVRVNFKAQCLVRADKEIPISETEGE